MLPLMGSQPLTGLEESERSETDDYLEEVEVTDFLDLDLNSVHDELNLDRIPLLQPDEDHFNWAQHSISNIIDSVKSLGQFNNGDADISRADYFTRLTECLLDYKSFSAGFISSRVKIFETYFKAFGMQTKDKKVVKWLKDGVEILWTNPFAISQQVHPRYRQKVIRVQKMLSKLNLPNSLDWFSGNRPKSVHLPNSSTVTQYAEFVRGEIDGLLKVGSLAVWDKNEPITVINGLAVVKNRHGKLRLILNAQYINVFDTYESFKYEKLTDVTNYLKETDEFILTDFKAGYHQLKMHPDTFTFLGIMFEGVVYYYTVLPFGLSSACKVYTQLMTAVYRPLRLHGQRCTFLIDDALFALSDQARSHSLVIIQVLSALGFFLSLNKCALSPAKQGKFLGLIVNTALLRFEVPTDKVQYISELVEEGVLASKNGTLTARNLAKIAGVLLSVKEAIFFAPLYTRLMFDAMKRQEWDNFLQGGNLDLALSDLLFWADNVQNIPYKSWIQRSNAINIYGDASETNYAGHTSVLEHNIVQAFSLLDHAAMLNSEFSSTLREVIAAKVCVLTVINQRTDLAKGGVVIYHGDNQSAIHCLNKFKGKGRILDEVKDLYKIAITKDVHLEFVWLPRSTPSIALADTLSRTEDDDHVILQEAVFLAICLKEFPKAVKEAHRGIDRIWGFPTCDVFAGPNPHEHKADIYFTRFASPESSGVNALNQDWKYRTSSNGKLLLWIFPPLYLIGETIKKLLEEKVAAILIVPKGVKYWTPIYNQLPIIDELSLSGRKNMFWYGSQLPRCLQQVFQNMHFKAARIEFSSWD